MRREYIKKMKKEDKQAREKKVKRAGGNSGKAEVGKVEVGRRKK